MHPTNSISYISVICLSTLLNTTNYNDKAKEDLKQNNKLTYIGYIIAKLRLVSI